MARLDRGPVSARRAARIFRRLRCRALVLPIPGPRHRCSRGLIGVFPKVHLRCLLAVPVRASRRCCRCSSPRSRRRASALVMRACWARTLRHGRARVCGARGLRVPGSREPDCVRDRVARDGVWLENLGVSRERCAAVLPRPAISLVWRTGFIAIPIRFRAAASSCCRLPPSWRCVRVCCYSTSPRLSSIPLPRRIFCTRCFA